MFKAVSNNTSAESKDIRWFYDQYAPMLLGYINGIVQDHQKSEDHLVAILTSFVQDVVILQEKCRLNSWLQLRQYAQSKLTLFAAKDHQLKPHPSLNKGRLDLLDDLQKRIFCAIYYHGKSVSYLAAAIGCDESEIRNQLKLSIDKMRRTSGN
ncbi:sigma-70 family RNA polymerase sigma factor [Pedobacter sp. MR2016-19]|uniref:RNA polymerase sigma factor n=1 Tax=Pedobacter sp. MR2016-19 TaxID=2780089 RepID=UPI001876C9F2|nr:sigma-70 family RNA polymerase sigma factor [Pedobacter sp. MR2016-19]MBE5318961.1 sigma-70 family RNA polymerase sigma factor [Pedobacter sp. MR2016-19]